MAAGTVAPVDDHHLGVGRRDERVDERHAATPGADDQVVGLELAHAALPSRDGREPRTGDGRRVGRSRSDEMTNGSSGFRLIRTILVDTW